MPVLVLNDKLIGKEGLMLKVEVPNPPVTLTGLTGDVTGTL